MRNAVGDVQSLLVLGGTSEIALATARKLVEGRTRRVVLAARDTEAAGRAADDLRAAGAEQVDVLAFDATDFASHEAAIDSAFAGGDVDCALVAFGVLGKSERLANDPAAAVELAQVNYTGVVSAGIALSVRMRRQGHGTIAFLSSVAGERVRKTKFV